MTADHVAKVDTLLAEKLNWKSKATVLCRDEEADLVLCRLEKAYPYGAASLGDWPGSGSEIKVHGYPYGGADQRRYTGAITQNGHDQFWFSGTNIDGMSGGGAFHRGRLVGVTSTTGTFASLRAIKALVNQ